MAAESRVAAVVGGKRVRGGGSAARGGRQAGGTRERQDGGCKGTRRIRVTPPDVVMCVGNGFILHTVNTALVVYNTKGQQLTAITPHNEFFNALPRNMGAYEGAPKGDAIGDMTCTYDHRSKRFYLATYWTVGAGEVSGFEAPPLPSLSPPSPLPLPSLSPPSPLPLPSPLTPPSLPPHPSLPPPHPSLPPSSSPRSSSRGGTRTHMTGAFSPFCSPFFPRCLLRNLSPSLPICAPSPPTVMQWTTLR
ncbi:unnamed protein product [Closterium sp. NIES-65]|nr:unnamed protein product [Closterium sp. NIES-65]CAI6003076.1 unnamed protein product [Closterium sp. NIES-65]